MNLHRATVVRSRDGGESVTDGASVKRSCCWCTGRGGCVSPQSCELPIDPPPARSRIRWPIVAGIVAWVAFGAALILT